MSDFTHLHVHSHYSLLDGLGKIEDLVQRTKDLGMDSVALTDHGVMYGTIDFYKTAKAAGIKPIIGVEAYVAPRKKTDKRGKVDTNPTHTTLLARDNTGYKNLIQLTSQAFLEGYYYKPRIDYELLKKHSEGLIVLSGCMNSNISKAVLNNNKDEIDRLVKWHLNVFDQGRFYLEVQHHPTIEEQTKINQGMFEVGKKYNVPLVATCDIHYIRPEDAEAQDVLVCVQTGKTVHDKDRLCMLGENLSLKSPEEMKKAWSDHPEVIENTQKIADMCNVELEFGVNKLPHYPLPPKESAYGALQKLCLRKLEEIYPKEKKEEAKKRLNYELDVIKKTGYSSYFLIVADFVNEAKRRGILVGPGRGSGAGSIVSYLTGITGLDPLHYNLLFERFLNPERVSMPDIDLDFADDRRDEIIEYVREKYGRDHVAQIITFGTMAARAAIRDAGRALGLPYSFCDKVAKAIPLFTNFEEALVEGSELKQMYDNDPQAKRLIDTAKKLEGVCRHASTHAAGVVITEEPLTDHVPLQLATSGDKQQQLVTQYAMTDVEGLGLLKMDFLGLKNLTIIKNALSYVSKTGEQEIDIDNLPLDDKPSYKLLQEGKTTGVFQLESSGMKRYLKELKPSEFEDIISMIALYRPGPMDSIPDFIAAKQGRKKIYYLHPILKPILEKTYGIIVTQDQVLEIARQFAGFSYAEADILRKAVGKKIKKLLVEQQEKFINGALENKGIKKETATKVWNFIEPFARYGFNRAHAACYAMIAYQTAYLKAHWPAEFMAALLTSDEGNTDRQAIEVAEAIDMGLEVLPPDINQSNYDFTVVKEKDKNKSIRFGLGAIKNVGHGVIEAAIQERNENGEFKGIFDLFRRINCKDFNRKSVESLARAGALDLIGERNQVLMNIDKLLEFNRNLHKQKDAGQQGLFGEQTAALAEPTVNLDPVEEAPKEEKLAWEKELLGLYVSEHPLQEWQDKLAGMVTPLHEVSSTGSSSKKLKVAGIITKINKIITKSQKPMLFVQLEDLAGKIETLVFPSLLEETNDMWEDGARLIIQGKLSDKDGEPKLLADKVWPLNDEILKTMKPVSKPVRSPAPPKIPSSATSISIKLPAYLDKNKLHELKQTLTQVSSQNNEGLAVKLIVKKDGQANIITTQYYIPAQEDTLKSIERITGRGTLRYK